jgi:hypothetical protein
VNDPESPSPDELRATPETADVAGRTVRLTAVAGRTIRLTAFLNRDFMPISPPGGKPLMVKIGLEAADGGTIPVGVAIERVWVLNGDETWSPPVERIAESVEVFARDGPKWAPGLAVEVVALVKDANGSTHRLRLSNQVIGRTD